MGAKKEKVPVTFFDYKKYAVTYGIAFATKGVHF